MENAIGRLSLAVAVRLRRCVHVYTKIMSCLCVQATLRQAAAQGAQCAMQRRALRTFQTGTLRPSRRCTGRSQPGAWHRATVPKAEHPLALQEGKVHSVREPPVGPEALLCTLRSRVFCRRLHDKRAQVQNCASQNGVQAPLPCCSRWCTGS